LGGPIRVGKGLDITREGVHIYCCTDHHDLSDDHANNHDF
jgi:hypothetical protein